MRALTVQQPWAWAIVHGGKDVENRTQAWSYRGPLAIHAGARVSQRGVDHELLRPEWATGRGHVYAAHGEARISYPTEAGPTAPNRLAAVMPLGAIIGVVELVDAHTAHADCCESWWAETAYAEHGGRTRRDIVHLILEHPRPLPNPIPARGRLGLWTPDPDTTNAILEQLGGGQW